jgi:hypothetical protein
MGNFFSNCFGNQLVFSPPDPTPAQRAWPGEPAQAQAHAPEARVQTGFIQTIRQWFSQTQNEAEV